MAEYRTVTAEATVIHRAVNATASVIEAIIPVDASVETTIAHTDMPTYDGAYTVVPNWDTQTLQTKNRSLTENIKVTPIPFESVSNLSGGRTVYIGGII